MTEQPDTAAIRAEYCQAPYDTDRDIVKQLCDALNAARAERERTVGEYIIAIDAAWTRAEAAEAELSEYRAMNDAAHRRMEAAEARGAEVYDQLQDARRRIAAAKAAFDLEDDNEAVVAMYHALTEGTDQ